MQLTGLTSLIILKSSLAALFTNCPHYPVGTGSFANSSEDGKPARSSPSPADLLSRHCSRSKAWVTRPVGATETRPGSNDRTASLVNLAGPAVLIPRHI